MGGCFQRCSDLVDHTIELLQHLMIPEPQHAPSACFQIRRAPLVGGRISMLAAIELDDQPRLDAGEVGNVRRHRMLATKPRTQIAAAQCAPEQRFDIRRLCAQSPRIRQGTRRNVRHGQSVGTAAPPPNPPPCASRTGEGSGGSADTPAPAPQAWGRVGEGASRDICRQFRNGRPLVSMCSMRSSVGPCLIRRMKASSSSFMSCFSVTVLVMSVSPPEST